MVTLPVELRGLYRRGLVIPFVGAGISRSVEWSHEGSPRRGILWHELVDEATKQLGFELPRLLRTRGTDLQILEYFRLRKGNLAPLQNWFFAEMRPPDDALMNSRVHGALAQLQKARLFYTTNFDDFLERGLALNGRKPLVIATETHMTEPSEDCAVIKFHGDWDNPDTMVVTESQYEERLGLSTAMDIKLRSDMLGHVLLFLGYSFRDPNVSYLFSVVKRKLGPSPSARPGFRAYIAIPDPSNFERSLFAARDIGVIALGERDLTAANAELVEALEG